MIDSPFQILISMVILIGGVIAGVKVFERESIKEGRNDGIVFCSENQTNVRLNTTI